MLSLGHENWIRYGWGPSYSRDFSNNDRLFVDLSNQSVKPKSMPSLDWAVHTVEKIVDQYPEPYTLMASGGGDSQSMVYAWKLSGVPFQVHTVRYVSDGVWFNEFDLKCLTKFSQRHHVDVEIHDLDIIDFLENHLRDHVKPYDGVSPHIAAHAKFTEFISHGTIIFSGNYIYPLRRQFCLDYSVLGLHRFSALMQDSGSKRLVPFFFLHSPGLAYSLDNQVDESVHPLYTHKDYLYKANGYDIVLPEKKYTGFELIKDYYDQFDKRVPPRLKLLAGSMPSRRIFDYLFRYALEINKVKNTPIYTFLE